MHRQPAEGYFCDKHRKALKHCWRLQSACGLHRQRGQNC